MKKIITIVMIICMILTTTVFAGLESELVLGKDIGSLDSVGIRSPFRSSIVIIRVIFTLLPLVLFLITFIYAIRWLINNKKDKESEKTKKLSKKAIGFAIATGVSFGVYIIFSGFIVPLTKMSGVL